MCEIITPEQEEQLKKHSTIIRELHPECIGKKIESKAQKAFF